MIMRCGDCGKRFPRAGAGQVRCNPCSWIVEPGFSFVKNQVSKAVRSGELPNLKATYVPCTDCGSRADRYDHRDYLKPLSVDPVCHQCNRLRGPGANLMVLSQMSRSARTGLLRVSA